MSKFNVGDKVRHKSIGNVGTIVSGNDADGYSVQYPCDDEEYYVRKDEIDFADAKGTFLLRLQSLLKEFDARIYSDFDQSDETNTMTIALGNDELVYPYVDFITADNVMDFDKE